MKVTRSNLAVVWAKWVKDVSEEQVLRELAIRYATRRIDATPCDPDPALTLDELGSFTKTFHNLCIPLCIPGKKPKACLDESGFLSFLTSLKLPLLVAVGPLLYRCVAYHAVFPFVGNIPPALTKEEFLRGLTMLSGREQRLLDQRLITLTEDGLLKDVIMRGRDETDRRRLLFQSLAVSARSTSPSGEALLSTTISTTANSTPTAQSSDRVMETIVTTTSKNDLLDVLAAIQPRMMTPLALQLNGADKALFAQLPAYNGDTQSVARCVLGAFTQDEAGGISYSVFERVIANSMPYLLEGLPYLFQNFFALGDISLPAPRPFPNIFRGYVGPILNFPLMAQLSLFLPRKVPHGAHKKPYSFFPDYPAMELLCDTRNGTPVGDSIDTTHSALLYRNCPLLFLISGRTDSGDTVIFGQYTCPSRSEDSRPPFLPGKQDERMMFQLAPRHDVFRLGKRSPDPAQIFRYNETEEVELGAGGPVRLQLRHDWKEAVFIHELTEDGPGCLPSEERGTKYIRFRVHGTELWAVPEQEAALCRAV